MTRMFQKLHWIKKYLDWVTALSATQETFMLTEEWVDAYIRFEIQSWIRRTYPLPPNWERFRKLVETGNAFDIGRE